MHPTGANPPNMVTPNNPARTYDRHTIDTLSDVADYMDRLNDQLKANGHDVDRCESAKINTNGYVCIFDAVVQITMQNNITGIGVQMWLCNDCFTQIRDAHQRLNE